MQKIILIVFGVWFMLNLSPCKGQEKSNEIEVVFQRNYRFLDSIKVHNLPDATADCKKKVKELEKITGITATWDGDYMGEIVYTRKDLKRWREWYENFKKQH